MEKDAKKQNKKKKEKYVFLFDFIINENKCIE